MELVQNAVAGLIVGLMVGLTGVGGGSLMAPILILIFGMEPAKAVGTDLWFAFITKSVGGFVHQRHGGPDWQIVRLLAYGSVPAAAITIWVLSRADIHQIKGGTIMQVLGVVLILTAIATLFRNKFHDIAARRKLDTAIKVHPFQPAATVIAGAILGVLVTLTSVGSGALGATMLLALYPIRLATKRLVATDIVHAVPLTLVAGLGHLMIHDVVPRTLAMLLVGSIPGIVIGSLLAWRTSDKVIRPLLAIVLTIAGYQLIAGHPAKKAKAEAHAAAVTPAATDATSPAAQPK